MNDAGEESVSKVETQLPTPTAAQAQVQQPQPRQLEFVPQLYLMFGLPFAVLALVLLIRALPFSVKTLAKKPLSCDACMAFWCSLVFGLGLSWMAAAHWSWTVLHMLATPGATMLLLAVYKWLTAPRELPLPPMRMK